MNTIQKITEIVMGILMLVVAVFMLLYPNDTYFFILMFLGFGLLATGIGVLIYYFTMAMFMVGGKVTLYKGVILIDFAILTLSFTDIPKVYILIYLAVVHAFSGFVEILRADETRKNGSKHFKLKLFHGFLNVIMAACCIIFIKKTNTAVLIYSLGLIYSAIIRIITAFRKTTFVYIQ